MQCWPSAGHSDVCGWPWGDEGETRCGPGSGSEACLPAPGQTCDGCYPPAVPTSSLPGSSPPTLGGTAWGSVTAASPWVWGAGGTRPLAPVSTQPSYPKPPPWVSSGVGVSHWGQATLGRTEAVEVGERCWADSEGWCWLISEAECSSQIGGLPTKPQIPKDL